MNALYLGRLLPDMDVCDVDGEKIGTIAHVYRHTLAAVGAGGAIPERPDVVEVKTGFLGLGEHLYVPVTAIHEAIEDCVFLAIRKAELPAEWSRRPDYLDELA